MRENLQAQIEQDVEKYAGDEGGDIARSEGSDLVQKMADRILALDISNDTKSAPIKAMLKDLGFEALSIDAKLRDIAKTAMKSVLDRDPGKALLEKAKAAAMMIVAYGEDSQDKVVADAKKGIEDYNTFLRQALVGYQAMAINDEFNEKELNPAKALFEGWVRRYGLSNLTVQSKTYGRGKFEDIAMKMFDVRIANAKKLIAETGKSEPLINDGFIKEFLSFLNESVIPELGAWDQSTRHNAFVKEIINKNAIAYKYLPPDVKDPYAETISDIVRLNVEGIYKVVDVAIKRAANVAENLTLTVEDFSRFKKVIDDLYEKEMKTIANNIENYNSFARSRVEMVKAMYTDEVSGSSAIRGYLKDAIKEQFKLDNVTDESLADAKIAETYSHLQKVLSDFVSKHLEEMQELAKSNVKPGETYEKIVKNDFYSAEELKAIYRDKAKDIVKNIANAGLFAAAADRSHKAALSTWSDKMKKAAKAARK